MKRKVRNILLFKGRSWGVFIWNIFWFDERGVIIRCVKCYLGNCGNFFEWFGERNNISMLERGRYGMLNL